MRPPALVAWGVADTAADGEDRVGGTAVVAGLFGADATAVESAPPLGDGAGVPGDALPQPLRSVRMSPATRLRRCTRASSHLPADQRANPCGYPAGVSRELLAAVGASTTVPAGRGAVAGVVTTVGCAGSGLTRSQPRHDSDG